MLTIGQLAGYAGTTIRAVRHYHQVGLLPEPPRDASGYRTYGVEAVVRLVRIRTLAEAGVPLARVQSLLDADPEVFAAAVRDIDQGLQEQVRALEEHRTRIAQLASGDTLAVPAAVQEYLELVRGLGAPDVVVAGERDAWMLVAARYPDRIPAFMTDKVAQLQDPRVVRFYRLVFALVDLPAAEHGPVVAEMADLLVELFEEAAASGRLEQQEVDMDDDVFARLLDSMTEAQPSLLQLRALLQDRGWSGWTRVERRPG